MQQQTEILCACNGLKCEGICRELYLDKPRITKSKTGSPVVWSKRCPEAYEKR